MIPKLSNRYHRLLFILFILITAFTLSACSASRSQGRVQIVPGQFIPDLKPEAEYTFTFKVKDQETDHFLTDASVHVTLRTPDDAIHELFRGKTDADGAIIVTYKTPDRKFAADATLEVQVQSELGNAQYSSQITLLPPLQIDIIEGVNQVAPGSQAKMVLQVVDTRTEQPAANIDIYAAIKLSTSPTHDVQEISQFRGQTDGNGRATFTLRTPFSLSSNRLELDILADSDIGQTRFTQNLNVVAPVTVEAIDLPAEIVAGHPISVTFQVFDNVNNEPAAFSDIRVHLSGPGYTNGWDIPEIDGQTDTNGQITLQVNSAATNYQTRLNIYAYAQAFEGTASFSRTIDVLPPLTLSLLGTSRQLAPDSQSLLQVRAWDNLAQQPAADVDIEVRFEGENLSGDKKYKGRTNADGLLRVDFTVPKTTASYLTVYVSTQTDQGASEISFNMNVYRRLSTLLTTDKPVYQPGQTIHIRALVLDSMTNQPVQNEEVQIWARDARGNKLLEQKRRTSEFGIVSTEIELDSQASSGDYQIVAYVDGDSFTQSVEVKPYTLPRFEIEFQTDHAYTQPGTTASGVISATYFFGKPVAQGEVVIRGYAPMTVNSDQEEQVLQVRGEMDNAGHFAYQLALPDTFRNRLANKTSEVRLEIEVTDPAGHLERVEESITLAEQPLMIQAVPESGLLKPGIENIVYIQASYPNGQAAQVPLSVTYGDELEKVAQLHTDEYGLTHLSFVPSQRTKQMLVVNYVVPQRADDGTENKVDQAEALVGTHSTTFEMETDSVYGHSLLLRPTQAQITAGQPLALTLFASGFDNEERPTTGYVEIKKADQTVDIVSVALEDGMGQANIELDERLVGTISLSAHLYLDENRQINDHRLLLINPASIDLDVTLDKEVYQPGDTAQLTVHTTQQTITTRSALGISIVDESVFALGSQEPGFVRTYFLLDRALTNAIYGIHDFVGFGNQDSPYDSYRTHGAARHSMQQPVFYTFMPADALQGSQPRGDLTHLAVSRQNALHGIMALDLRDEKLTKGTETVDEPSSEAATASLQTSSSPLQTRWFVGIMIVIICAIGVRRRYKVPHAVLVVLISSGLLWTACAAPSSPPPTSSADAPAASPPSTSTDPESSTLASASRPRLRQFFPETLMWLPEVITDEHGYAQIDVPIADSITTWRISITAVDEEGHLGSTQAPLRVFQDFFVEPQVPSHLTQGDLLEVPVSLFNYLDEAQEIRLEIADAEWFEPLWQRSTDLVYTVPANEVTVIYLPLQVTGVGHGLFTLTAFGNTMSDAVQREVEIVYDGEAQTTVQSGLLRESIRQPLPLPKEIISGTGRATLKIYPSIIGQVRNSLNGVLKKPQGCFEQVTSQNFINVQLLDYLRSIDAPQDVLYHRSQRLAQLGYQRMLVFESMHSPGGFGRCGYYAPDPTSTAYGLMQFAAMNRVRPVETAIFQRMRAYLYKERLPDGSWHADRMRYYGNWDSESARLATTAFIAWALAESNNSGYDSQFYGTLNYLVNSATNQELDPYTTALVANALIASQQVEPNDDVAETLAHLLDQLIQTSRQQDGLTFWRASRATFMGAHNRAADLEATALAAHAFLQAGSAPEISQSALDYLLSHRDEEGLFFNTYTTVFALRTLLLAAQQDGHSGSATIIVQLEGDAPQQLTIDSENRDGRLNREITVIEFDHVRPGQAITVAVEGTLAPPYQLITDYYLPWQTVAQQTQEQQEQENTMAVKTTYDHTSISANQIVHVQTTLDLQLTHRPGTLIVEVGIPPGFTPIDADLDELVASQIVSHVERRSRSILLYLLRVHPQRTYTIDFRMLARTPGTLLSSPTMVYSYYAPEIRDIDPPLKLEIGKR